MYQIKKMRADHVIDFAAEELKKYLRMMMPECGEIGITYQPAAADGFRLGLMEDFGLDTSEAEDLVLDDILHIEADLNGGIIAGSNPRSVLMAVYRYLRENGCRWLYPGIDGEYIPVADIRAVNYHKMADHRFRGVCNEGAESQQCMMETIDFNPKVGMNVYMMEFDNPYYYYNVYYSHKHNEKNRPPEPVSYENVKQWKRLCEAEIAKRGLQFHDMGHGWTAEPFGLDSTDGWRASDGDVPEENRQYLALLNGKRELFGKIPLNTNLCMSNPAVQEIMARAIADYAETHGNVDYLHVWLADGSRNHCECPECQKARPADFYLQIMNRLDELLTARKLKTRIVFIAYVDTLFAPEQETIRNPERFSLLFAPITRTYTASANAATPQIEAAPYRRNQWQEPKSLAENLALLREWKKVWPGCCFEYEYHFWRHQYYDLGGLYLARRIFEDVQGLQEIGVDGYVEDGSQRSFFPNGFAMYTYASKLFDRQLTFEEIKEDYFSHAYGADWQQAAALLEQMGALFDFAYMAGERSAEEARGRWYAPERAEQLKKAAALAGEECALAQQHSRMPMRVQTVSWRLLQRHAELCTLMAEVMTEKAMGHDERAAGMKEAMFEQFGRHEFEIERYFDQGLWAISLNRMLRTDRKKSAVTGM